MPLNNLMEHSVAHHGWMCCQEVGLCYLPAPAVRLCNDSPTIRELASGEASFLTKHSDSPLPACFRTLRGVNRSQGRGRMYEEPAHYDAWWGPDPGFGKNSSFHQDRETGKSTSAFLEVKHYWSQDVLEVEKYCGCAVLGLNVDESKRGKWLGCFSRRLHRLRTHAWKKIRADGMEGRCYMVV